MSLDNRRDDPGILLTNLGTPDAPSPRALRRYLGEFLMDPRIVDVPRPLWWLILHGIVLTTRPRRSARLYQRIWTPEGSPLLFHTQALAVQVGTALRHLSGRSIRIEVGMRYGNPSLASALDTLLDGGVRRVLLVPLYPQYSATTTGSTVDALAVALAHHADQPAIRTVRSYPVEPLYLDAIAGAIESFWQAHGRGTHLLFSYHGLPQRYVDRGDPYPTECSATTDGVIARLGLERDSWSQCFQSRFGPGAWLAPATLEHIRRLGQERFETLDVICPGFAADCLETLEEIAISGAEAFRSAGGGLLRYIPALNASPPHAEAMTSIVLRELRGWLE